MKFDVLTIFPQYFDVLRVSLLGKAIDAGKFDVSVANIRDFSKDKHLKTDDTPYGGGAGMVMTPDPIVSAIESVDPNHEAWRIYMSPRGKKLDQKKVESLAERRSHSHTLRRLRGVDQRAIDLAIDEELSIGDYVLTGGELPALVVINAVARYVDGVLGSDESTKEESFSNGLLEYPQYTRPDNFRGFKCPKFAGRKHKDIEKWRLEKSLEHDENRPDLLTDLDISQFLPTKKTKTPSLTTAFFVSGLRSELLAFHKSEKTQNTAFVHQKSSL